MKIVEFIGTWKNEAGNILEISGYNVNTLCVNFVSGKTGKPVIRDFYNSKASIGMKAHLDFYGSSLEVELWKKGKGFQLVLLYDFMNFRDQESEYCLTPGLSRNADDNLTKQYNHLFEPLDYYRRIGNCP